MPEANAAPAVAETPNSVTIDVPRKGRQTPTERQSAPVQAQPAAEAPNDGAQPPLAASVAVNEPEPAPASEQPKTSEENQPQATPPAQAQPSQSKDWRTAQPVPGQPAAEDPKPGDVPQPDKPVRDYRIDGFYRLQDRIRELETKLAQPPATAQPSAAPQPVVANPAGKPVWIPENYADKGGYDAFMEDLADYKADQKIEAKLQERDRKQAEDHARAEAKRATDTWAQRVKTANIPNYDEIVGASQLAFRSPAAQDLLTSILVMGKGPHVVMHLISNPDEVARIDSLPRHKQFAELAKLEDQYSKPPAAQVDVPPVQTPLPSGASTAPAPIKPLRPTANNAPDDPAKIAGATAENSDFRRYAAAAGLVVQKGRFGDRRN